MEIEIRAQIKNYKEFKEIFNKFKEIKFVLKEEQLDTYFKNEGKETGKMVIRIRKNGEKEILTFKCDNISSGEDVAWLEHNSIIKDSEILKKILLNCGYKCLCQIDKIRETYKYDNYEINIDEIKGLGIFIEIEILIDDESNNEGILNAKTKLTAVLKNIGIQESDIINKGYVRLMLEKNK